MKNKQVFYWFLDLIILIIFLAEYSLNLTGLQWHELLGLGVGALLMVHLLTHWQWVISVSKRLVASTQGKAAMCYGIDFILMGLFAGIILTGLLISSLLNLPLTNYDFWRFLHVTISYMTLVVVGLKISLHWSWIVNTTKRKIFQHNRRIPQPASAAVLVNQDQGQYSRRQFLAQTGLFTGAMIFAGLGYGKWIANNLLSGTEQQSTTNVQVQASTGQATATVLQPQTASVAAQQATAVPTSQPTVVVQSTATSVPTVQAVVPVAAKSVPTCNRNCSYPGHCHRYVDSNNNNRCDHSESI